MQSKDGERQGAPGLDGLWWAQPPPAQSMVRSTKEGGKMDRPKSTEGGASNLQPVARPAKGLGQVPATLHRVQISPPEVDALAMRAAFEKLQSAGLRLDAVGFAMRARVTRRADGGLVVEVDG